MVIFNSQGAGACLPPELALMYDSRYVGHSPAWRGAASLAGGLNNFAISLNNNNDHAAW
jgi:hypothetical protein